MHGLSERLIHWQLTVWFKYNLGHQYYAPQVRPAGFEPMTCRPWQYISCHWDACCNHSAISETVMIVQQLSMDQFLDHEILIKLTYMPIWDCCTWSRWPIMERSPHFYHYMLLATCMSWKQGNSEKVHTYCDKTTLILTWGEKCNL